MAMHWYVVHTYSQFEKSVQRALTERIQRDGMQDKFGQIMVPVEEVVELKSGQKSITERKFFPGYVLVEMEMTDESWHLVKNTPKVTGFLGGSAMKPTPISAKEVQNIMQQMQAGVEKPRPKVLFEVGELVRVKEGPFTDFNGSVEDVNYDKNKIRVAVTIFGRSTPVELDLGEVEKALKARSVNVGLSLQKMRTRFPCCHFSCWGETNSFVRTRLIGVHHGKKSRRLHQAASACW